MTASRTDVERWAPSTAPYREWLQGQDPHEARLWEGSVAAAEPGQVEGAVAEAVAWDWLVHRVETIERGVVPDRRSPDFRCRSRGVEFHVEVTNVSRPAMTEATGLEDAEIASGTFRPPTERLHREIKDKSGQGRELGAPYVIFVTTLHWNGSGLLKDRKLLAWVLHSPKFLCGTFDPERGEVVGGIHNVTDFKRAAFTRSRTHAAIRQHVSAVLFGPFGHYPDGVGVLGLLNPEAAHPFDHRLLPETPFGRFRNWPPRPDVIVDWTDQPALPIVKPRARPGLWTP